MRFSAKYYMTAVSAVAASLVCASAAHADTPIGDTGVSIFATVDVGYGYQTTGAPSNNAAPGGLEYQSFTTSRNFSGGQSTLTNGAMEQSKIGLAFSEKIGESGFAAIGRMETAFNPLAGTLADGCKSLMQNAGVVYTQQTSSVDSSRCGQTINGVIFGGFTNKQFGTLTVGRQLALQGEQLAAYDPQLNAPAFSFLGFSGFLGGAGSTEALRLDNAVKYTYKNDQYHVNLLYAQGGSGTGVYGHSYAADIGVNYAGFQIDAVYQHIDGAVNLRNAGDASAATPLTAFTSKNTSISVMGKYALEMAHKAKLTMYIGYEHAEKADAGLAATATVLAQNDYSAVNKFDVAASAPAKYDAIWGGVRYAMADGTALSAGLYHISQNTWAVQTAAGVVVPCSAAKGLLCSGNFNEASFAVDKPLMKHVDVYAGVNWSKVTDGLASGFYSQHALITNSGSVSQTGFYTGVRVKF